MVPFLKDKVTLFAKTVAVVGNNGWELVINGNYNGFQWKAQ